MSEEFDLHWNRGWEFYEAGNFEVAIAEWRAAAELDPEDGYVLNNIGRALSKLGRKEEAIAEWRKAVRLEPDYHRPHTNLAYALSDSSYSPEALAAVRAAIRLSPDDAELYDRLGYCLNELACEDNNQYGYEAAEEAFQQAINIAPANSYALHSLGIVKWSLGKKREAIKMQKAAIAADPNYIEAYLKLTEYQTATGQFRDMMQTINITNELPDPEEKVAYYYSDLIERMWLKFRPALFIVAGLAAVLVGVWIWNWRRER